MTGSDDSNSSTRPISVAELLAKNGTIGAPPVGGRRRRRRGNADAVTVAELTGEIPIIRPDDPPPVAAPPPQVEPPAEDATVSDVESPAGAAEAESPAEPSEADVAEADVAEVEAVPPEAVPSEVDTDDAPEGTVGDTDDDTDDDYADAVAEHTARVEERDTDPAPEPAPEPARRFGFGRFGRKEPAAGAETWTPDPVDGPGADIAEAAEVTDELDEPVEIEAPDAQAPVADTAKADTAKADTDDTVTADDLDADDLDADDLDADDLDADDLDDEHLDADDDADDDRDELPSYLRSTEDALFGGQSVADDLARRRGRTLLAGVDGDLAGSDLDDDLDDDEDAALETGHDEPRQMSSVVHALWIIGQSVVAVIFGAGLFVAFDQLWKWNNIVALVLSVLVILGLVVGVRVVRKTEDIGSTLIAVAVGALVTLGPLALLQSG
ncbi:hypothetical protein FHR72_000915 [Mycolicibacterium iranicum]|uniref:FUSC family protein n=1 Tax=Mycolicibacterium iranicum TaxID=912594 RepID=A0A839Q8A0_MYCIR|nr:hypothetical protein [Mycolicibacterium iranicum]MBB2989452.1 hypothetical protein [Mycolicibacterium iranicum]